MASQDARPQGSRIKPDLGRFGDPLAVMKAAGIFMEDLRDVRPPAPIPPIGRSDVPCFKGKSFNSVLIAAAKQHREIAGRAKALPPFRGRRRSANTGAKAALHH